MDIKDKMRYCGIIAVEETSIVMALRQAQGDMLYTVDSSCCWRDEDYWIASGYRKPEACY